MNYNNPDEAWYHGLKRKPQGEGCLLSMLSVTFIALAIALMLAFSGCTTTRYVPVEHHTTDTVYQSKLQRDSVWLHDSIHVSEKGDTIRIERWRTKYISKEVRDTIYRAKTDSIPVPYEVIKEVPRKSTWFERIMFCTGIVSILCLILFVAKKIERHLP
jgi:hypothetical protein